MAPLVNGIMLMEGKEAAGYAAPFWQALDEKTRRVILWDVRAEDRPAMLAHLWEEADCVALFFQDRQPKAAAWAGALGPGSHCGMIHFSFAREARKDAETIARNALKKIFEETELLSLLGLIPARFRHAITFTKKIGFTASERLAGACPVNGRLEDGILVTINKRNFCDVSGF